LIETEISSSDIVDEGVGDETQPALPGGNETDDELSTNDGENETSDNETVEEGSGQEASENEFPEGYDDYARQFKDYFEEMLEEKDSDGKGLMLSLTFAIWASKFPKDANLVGAALLMSYIYDDELVTTILDDFTEEDYKKRLTEYDPIDEELSSWFMAIVLFGMIFANSKDDEPDDKITSEEYAEKYISLADDFQSAGEDRQNELYGEMKNLIKDWKGDYPQDLNMSLAYITLNAPYLSDEKLNELLENLKDQSFEVDGLYERLYMDCKTVLELKNIDLDDYLEE
jgi:hypothetical protein